MSEKSIFTSSNISISGFIHKDLGEFAEELQKDAIYNAKQCLKRRFSGDSVDGVDDDDINKYFIYIIKQKGWKVQKEMIPGAPIAFFTQEDIQNDTMLHMIAKQDVSKLTVENQFLNGILQDFDVKMKIITKLEERKDFLTPLEVAIKNLNYGFIGEFFRSIWIFCVKNCMGFWPRIQVK